MGSHPHPARPLACLAALLLATLCPTFAHALTHHIVVTASGNQYEGWSVASAGDLNGDGVPDLIAGGYGVARLLYLGANADTAWDGLLTDDPSLTGAPSEAFGIGVAGGADLDGDGQVDLVVSNPYWSLPCGHNSCFNHGRIHLLPKNATNTADDVMTAESGVEFDELGWNVVILPDFNGDGSADIAAAGRQDTRLWFGGTALDSVPDRVWPYGNFSPRVASAGDWNGDGYGDLALVNTAGKARIEFGGPVATAGQTLGGLYDQAWVIAGGGDLNGDGYDDLAVARSGSYPYRQVDVFFGGPSADSLADVTILPMATDTAFAWSMAIVGDVNGDGNADLAVGSWSQDRTDGRVSIYLGGPQFDAIVDDTLQGPGLGTSLAGLGDVNGDGRADLAIGCVIPGPAGQPNGVGRVEVVSFSPVLDSPPAGPIAGAPRLTVRGNPARATVRFSIALDRNAPVSLAIHDLAGRVVARLLDRARVDGWTSEVAWVPGHLPAGVYLARLRVGDRTTTTRCVWLGP